jgi:DNA adenine methylase
MPACRTPTRGAFFILGVFIQVTLYDMGYKLTGAALRWHLFNLPFGWLGSKATMLDVILPNIPEHKHYVEPFCGTAIVYLHKSPSRINTLNDIDENIVNFFRVLQDRDKTRELLRRLRYTPYAKSEYRKACLLLSSARNIDDVTRAWAFYVAQQMSMKISYYADPEGQYFRYIRGRSKTGIAYRTLVNKVGRLMEIAIKMRQCQILNKDGLEVMKMLDHESVFMFIDPPYLSTTLRSKSKIYNTDYNDELHYKLIDFVRGAKSKIMLASYPNELYDQLLDYGWVRIDKMKLISAGNYTRNRKRQPRRIESLYLNYQPPNPNITSCRIVSTTPRLTS